MDMFIVFLVSNGLTDNKKKANDDVFFGRNQSNVTVGAAESTLHSPFFSLFGFSLATAAINHRRVFFPFETTIETSIYDTDTIPFNWP